MLKQNPGKGCEKNDEQPPDHVENNEAETELSAHSTALLGVINDIKETGLFRLDFNLDWTLRNQSPNVVKRTFVLKQMGMRGCAWNYGLTKLRNYCRQPSSSFQNSHGRENFFK